MLRTVARERLGVDSDVLEVQLAHARKGNVQKAYDCTTFNDERRRVMQPGLTIWITCVQAGK